MTELEESPVITTDTATIVEPTPPTAPAMSAAQRLALSEQRKRTAAAQAKAAAMDQYRQLVRSGDIDTSPDGELERLATELGITAADIDADVSALRDFLAVEQMRPGLQEQIETARAECTSAAASAKKAYDTARIEAEKLIVSTANAASAAVNRLGKLKDADRAAEQKQNDLRRAHSRVFD